MISPGAAHMYPSSMIQIIKQQLVLSFCSLLIAATSAQPVIAATSRGIEFDDTAEVEEQVLHLHGIGLLKWKYLVNVYLVGLYKQDNVSIDDLPGIVPMRLEYYFFVDMKAGDFQSTGYQLMARNVGEEKTKKLSRELEAFNSLYQDVKAGQRYTLTFLPGRGLEMALDGRILGVVEGDEFGSSYLAIWLGPDPVSKGLRDGLFDPSTLTK